MDCRGASRVANGNSRLIRTQTQKTPEVGVSKGPSVNQAHRVLKITDACEQLIRKSREKIWEVARVIGLLVAAIPAVELGKLHYR
ncbi:hypothetical protein E2C01_048365 [Portunus trituberculatus]|uniref:Uncharacterized protein n=1 Tax=Portunus trituberculatus TaxID=210409 RepID=A0A5B7GA12_PORTR|nr:hypothetical protein [Portunus trituberculatus]